MGQVTYNNPYLINLLVYQIKRKLGITNYDMAMSKSHYDIVTSMLETRVPAVDDTSVKNFLGSRSHAPGIPIRYFASESTLNDFVSFIGFNSWKEFLRAYGDAASEYEPNIDTSELGTPEVYDKYYSYYKHRKDDIKSAIIDLYKRISQSTNFRHSTPFYISAERTQLIDYWSTRLGTNEKPLAILGEAGIGKTNLALNLFNHTNIFNRFAHRRWLVDCELLKDAEAFVKSVAQEIDLGKLEDVALEQQIIGHLARGGGQSLLLFDNFETTYDSAIEEISEFLGRLGRVATLMFTIRRTSLPEDLDWNSFTLDLVDELEAVQVFHEYSGRKFEHEPLVPEFVKEMERLPLALELLGRRARGVQTLSTLYQAWKTEKLKLLEIRPREKSKNFNLELSISFSVNNPLMTDPARNLLKVISVLPGQIFRDDISKLLPSTFNTLSVLLQLGLVREIDNGRISIHRIIREYMHQQPIKYETTLEILLNDYLQTVLEAGRNLRQDPKAKIYFRENWVNILYALRQKKDTELGVSALCECVEFGLKNLEVTSLIPLLENGEIVARQNGWISLQALSSWNLGRVFLVLKNNRSAEKFLGLAIELYSSLQHHSNNVIAREDMIELLIATNENEAAIVENREIYAFWFERRDAKKLSECLSRFGSIFSSSGCKHIGTLYLIQAVSLYRAIGDEFGQSECLMELAKLSLRNGDRELGRQYCEMAYNLTPSFQSKLREVNCRFLLGITIGDTDPGEAERHLVFCLTELEGSGISGMITECLLKLGSINLIPSPSKALRFFNMALSNATAAEDQRKVLESMIQIGKIGISDGSLINRIEYFEQIASSCETEEYASLAAQCYEILLKVQDRDVIACHLSYLMKITNLYRKLKNHDSESYYLNLLSLTGAFATKEERRNVDWLAILFRKGELAMFVADFRLAKKVFEEYLSIINADTLEAAKCISRLGEIAHKMGYISEAISHFTTSHNKYRELELFDEVGYTSYKIGECFQGLNKNEDARRHFQLGLEEYPCTSLYGKGTCQTSLGDTFYDESKFDLAQTKYLAAYELLKQVPNCLEKGKSLLRLGQISSSKHEFEDALVWFKKARESFEALDSLSMVIYCLEYIGTISILLDNWHAALNSYEEARNFALLTRSPSLNSISSMLGSIFIDNDKKIAEMFIQESKRNWEGVEIAELIEMFIEGKFNYLYTVQSTPR